jgi:hypothetical protein
MEVLDNCLAEEHLRGLADRSQGIVLETTDATNKRVKSLKKALIFHGFMYQGSIVGGGCTQNS